MLRSVKNWLTILFVIVVALAMAVAWVYVVPPLGARLDQQKLVDMRGNVNIISSTVNEFVRYDPVTKDTVITDRASLDEVIRRLSLLLNARTVVLARSLLPRTDTAGVDPFDVADYPMLADAVKTGEPAQGIALTPTGRYAAMAVPLFAASSSAHGGRRRCWSSRRSPTSTRPWPPCSARSCSPRGWHWRVSLVLGYLASYFIARRLKRIERSAETIAGGDLTAKVEVTVDDEIGQLGDHLQHHGDAPARARSPRWSTSATAWRCCSTT